MAPKKKEKNLKRSNIITLKLILKKYPVLNQKLYRSLHNICEHNKNTHYHNIYVLKYPMHQDLPS